MAQQKPSKGQRVAIYAGSIILVLICLATVLWFGGVRYNATASQPKGFYHLDRSNRQLELGALVFVCPPDTPLMKEALERGYFRVGTCSGGYAPLLKRIVGLADMEIRVEDDGVYVNDVLQEKSVPHILDGNGRPLPRYQGGIIRESEVFLLSGYNDGSFDSRYFGPLERELVIGRATPIW